MRSVGIICALLWRAEPIRKPTPGTNSRALGLICRRSLFKQCQRQSEFWLPGYITQGALPIGLPCSAVIEHLPSLCEGRDLNPGPEDGDGDNVNVHFFFCLEKLFWESMPYIHIGLFSLPVCGYLHFRSSLTICRLTFYNICRFHYLTVCIRKVHIILTDFYNSPLYC